MAFHYSGAILSSTPATSNDQLRDAIQAALLISGWEQTGTVSGGYVLKSVITPESLQCEVTVLSAVVVEITFAQVGGAGALLTHYLRPIPAPLTYSLHVGPYQFFIYAPGLALCPRTFVAGGTPHLPAPMGSGHTHMIWSQANSNSATDTTLRRSFRTVSDAQDALNAYQNTDGVGGPPGVAQRWANPNNAGGNGSQRLFAPTGLRGRTQFTGAHENSGFCWGQGDLQTSVDAVTAREGVSFKLPPIIGWGLHSESNYPRAKGELWDAMMETSPYPEGNETDFDSQRWVCLTHMNVFTQSRVSIWLTMH